MSSITTLFVNREKQTAGFIKMLEGGTPKRIMMIDAPGGLGKSWTIEYMREECLKRAVPHVEIDFADGIVYDFLAVLRRARDSFGAEKFNAFTQAINEVTQPSVRIEGATVTNASLNIAEGASVSDSSLTTGDNVIGTLVKDNSFVINTDSAVMRQAIQDRLTTAFFECLAALTAKGPICFFFDTYDRVTVEADSWLLTQLLPRIREGKLTNIVVVITGRSVPKLESLWDSIVARTNLDLFSVDHVREYLVQRCGLTNVDVNTLFNAGASQPQLLALLAENLRRAQNPGGQNDWL